MTEIRKQDDFNEDQLKILQKYIKVFIINVVKIKYNESKPVDLEFSVEDIDFLIKLMHKSSHSL